MLHTATLLFLEGLRTPVLNEVAVAVTAFGSLFTVLIIIYTLYHFDQTETAVLAFSAILIGGAVEKVLNIIVARPRPEVVTPLITAYPPGYAFPSGHTTLAFALATVLETEIDGSNYLFFVLAAVVGLSRMYLGLHFPGDVLAGAVLGVTAGLLVHRYREPLLAAADRYI